MIIFFTASSKDILAHKEAYLEIRNSIKALGHSINRDWINYSIEVAEKNRRDVPTPSIYQDVMTAILTADLIIADASVRSMSIGHQITFALQKKKPVLLLQKLEGRSEAQDLFISGAKSPLLMIKNYTRTEEIRSLIKKFIQKYEATSKTRFNLVLNKAQDGYVEWAAFYYKISKTEVIQNAIDEKMESDRLFEKYLES
ncbi:MAG: hypothetical protein M1352_00525 [Patescibacteria group bacterium]|nr:hypothetical protein [Patescibacteria group bacterium]